MIKIKTFSANSQEELDKMMNDYLNSPSPKGTYVFIKNIQYDMSAIDKDHVIYSAMIQLRVINGPIIPDKLDSSLLTEVYDC